MKKLLVFVGLMFVAVAYAQTETINWYNEDKTSYATTTCETGNDIILPTTPTKRGHTFTGWSVALYDFSTLDAYIGGSASAYDETAKTWTATFPYGTISGVALCSQTPGTYAEPGVPDESGNGDTPYCWCKAMTYKPVADDTVYKNASGSSWVFTNRDYSYSGNNICSLKCAYACAINARSVSYADFRRGLFGITQ